NGNEGGLLLSKKVRQPGGLTDKLLRGTGLLNWKGKFPVQYFVDDIHRIIFTDRGMPELFIEIADDVEPFRIDAVSPQRGHERIERVFNVSLTAVVLDVIDLFGKVPVVSDRCRDVQPVEQGVLHIFNLVDAV